MGRRVAYDRTFGDWLSAQLKEAGGNRGQLARYLGPDGRRVSNWLAGRERPSPEACERIAAALGLPTRTVLTKAGLRPERAAVVIAAASVVQEIEAAMPRSDDAMSPNGDAALPLPLLAGVTDAAADPDPPAPTADGAEVVRRPPRRRRTRRPPVIADEAGEQSPTTPTTEPPQIRPLSPQQSSMLERIGALRVLADDLERAAHDLHEMRAEVERLREERDRLAEANRRLQDQIDHARAALFPDDARRS